MIFETRRQMLWGEAKAVLLAVPMLVCYWTGRDRMLDRLVAVVTR